ncbi:HNH endonuclease [Streptomyces sp. NPDC002537]
MDMPSWRDEKLGTMKRAALWLIAVVGEGNTFTKTQLREAFPDTAQIDRRMRDLRDFGWVIATNREDDELEPHEQRFVAQGIPVWEPGKATRTSTTISMPQRRQIFARDGHICRSCGVTTGQSYEGSHERVQLDIARREVVQPDGSKTIELVTECKRCRVGGRELTAQLPTVLSRVRELGALERKIFAGWVAEDQREFSPLDRLWGEYRALPAESRDKVREALNGEGEV